MAQGASPLENALWGSMWSQRYTHLPLSSKYRLLGGLLLPRQARLNLPQLFPIASPCFCPIHQRAGSMRMRTVCVSHAIPWSAAPSLAHSGPEKRPLKEAQLLTDTASRCPVKVYRCWQLWASQMRMSLLRSPEAYGDKDNGQRHPLCAHTSHPPSGPTQPYQVLAVRRDGHAEDVGAVAGGLPFGALLGSRDHMKFPSTLHAPWHQGEDRCY